MSMPIIKPSNIKRCEAITDIIESVALEQVGLSHILNAEGEKIQAALEISKNSDEILKVNKSVQAMVNSVTRLETILQGKLELFNECLCISCPVEACTSSRLKLELSNPNAGKIVKGDSANTYFYSGSKIGTDIKFITNPEVEVQMTSVIPNGMSFANKSLNIPNDFKWDKAYEMKFMIGTDDCKYEVAIITETN